MSFESVSFLLNIYIRSNENIFMNFESITSMNGTISETKLTEKYIIIYTNS